MNQYTQLVKGVIKKYADTYPDLTEEELQQAMASEIVDVLIEHERVKANHRTHNRTDVKMNDVEIQH